MLSQESLQALFNGCVGLIGAIVGGVFTLLGAIYTTNKAHKNNLALQEEEKEKEEKAVINLLHDTFEKILYYIKMNFGSVINDKSPYGYINYTYNESKFLIDVIEKIMGELSKVTDYDIRSKAIENYTELKCFITVCDLYNEQILRLADFRQENLNEEQFKEIKYAKYLGIDIPLFEEEKKSDTKLPKDFIEQHTLAIKGIVKRSNKLIGLYNNLSKEINEFLEMTNGRK